MNRLICLTQINFNIYTRILKERLRKLVESKLEQRQMVLRSEKETNDNVVVLGNIIKRAVEEGEDLFPTFID